MIRIHVHENGVTPGTGPFWEVVALMVISCGLMYLFFKRSGWL